jgi:N-methylhydantoinase B
MNTDPLYVYKPAVTRYGNAADADPFTTELIRNALTSTASQMKQTLIRAAYSPIIYEAHDFAVVLYDKHLRLLAQAPALPIFMGTMNFCIEATVEAAGGVESLEPGDVLLYNWPYGTGSHAQDASITIPVFLDDGELIGYAACKAHWMDIGAKDPYCTDTVNVYQEGVFFPGVRLWRRGEWNTDVVKMVRANTRIPDATIGDINAQIACCRIGAQELVRIITRFGKKIFDNCIERMLDHGEAMMRSYLEKLPDGVYSAKGSMDNNGVTSDPIDFEIGLEVAGSNIRIDFSKAPDAVGGPVNCPLASTVSGARVVVTMLANAMESPNEGHYRPIQVVTRPGSLFHPTPPAPCFLFGWSLMPAMEALLKAIGEATPALVPARSGGCILTLIWWGTREKTGEVWAAGSPLPVGQGAHAGGDGGTMIHMIQAFGQVPPMELWEAKFPWLIESYEFAADSSGPGEHVGGQGINISWRMLEDCSFTSTVEQTKTKPWGLGGGVGGRSNYAEIRLPDGTTNTFGKVTAMKAPKGSVVTVRSGGGGGYGPAQKRDRLAILADIRKGLMTEEFARKHFAQAFRPISKAS